jgi:preprotein translocase subunit SecB
MSKETWQRIDIRTIALLETSLRAVPEGDPANELNLKHQVRVHEAEKSPGSFTVSYHLTLANSPEKPYIYEGTVSVVGAFKIGSKKADWLGFLKVKACEILYSIVREQVFSFTSRSVVAPIHGPLILPFLNFEEGCELGWLEERTA